jgi:hypothetical protein
VALKVETGSGVDEWGKQYGGCCFCGPFLYFGTFLLLKKRVFVLGIVGLCKV